MPYGTVTDHGTMFVGFAGAQRRLSAMLESMAGLTTGTRDALTRFTSSTHGAPTTLRPLVREHASADRWLSGLEPLAELEPIGRVRPRTELSIKVDNGVDVNVH